MGLYISFSCCSNNTVVIQQCRIDAAFRDTLLSVQMCTVLFLKTSQESVAVRVTYPEVFSESQKARGHTHTHTHKQNTAALRLRRHLSHVMRELRRDHKQLITAAGCDFTVRERNVPVCHKTTNTKIKKNVCFRRCMPSHPTNLLVFSI